MLVDNWDQACRYLSERDPQLAEIIKHFAGRKIEYTTFMTPFAAITRSIVFQQLSTKAAATIHQRLMDLFPSADEIFASHFLMLDEKTVRSAGISKNKFLALTDLASKVEAGAVPDFDVLNEMTDEAIIETLTAIRGVGRWTVEMLLIFTLKRADVLPLNDLGIRKGFARIYGTALPTPKMLGIQGEQWQPYRSVASWYCWRATELHYPAN